jgi:hypothetical protein
MFGIATGKITGCELALYAAHGRKWRGTIPAR